MHPRQSEDVRVGLDDVFRNCSCAHKVLGVPLCQLKRRGLCHWCSGGRIYIKLLCSSALLILISQSFRTGFSKSRYLSYMPSRLKLPSVDAESIFSNFLGSFLPLISKKQIFEVTKNTLNFTSGEEQEKGS